MSLNLTTRGSACSYMCPFVFDSDIDLYVCSLHDAPHICTVQCLKQRGSKYVCNITQETKQYSNGTTVVGQHKQKTYARAQSTDSRAIMSKALSRILRTYDIDPTFLSFSAHLFEAYRNTNTSLKTTISHRNKSTEDVFIAALFQCVNQKVVFIPDGQNIKYTMTFPTFESACEGGNITTVFARSVSMCTGAAAVRTRAMSRIKSLVNLSVSLQRMLPSEMCKTQQ